MTLNILFVLYHDFTANSASHVHALANELELLGQTCAVAVPADKHTNNRLGRALYTGVEFSEIVAGKAVFANGRGPDIIHAWTPRENVRKICQVVRSSSGARLYVHMEDNEWFIVARALGVRSKDLANIAPRDLDAAVPANLSHPQRGMAFLSQSDGITVIIDRLAELIPKGIPTLEVWPSAARDLFYPRPIRIEDRRKLGIPGNATTLVYTGNVHAANAHEVRSLYLAVAILNREGHPTVLVRAGRDFHPFLGPDESWARQHTIDLGLVGHTEIPSILALADIFVQPGKADEFNEFRFPSKLPEFLSIGRPVIIPASNIARHMVHGCDAYILPVANGISIAEAVRKIVADKELAARLSAGALRFFEDNLDWSKRANDLLQFYAKCEHKGEQHEHKLSPAN